ncbi:hypothetical protein GGS23DRAFT_379405 [Durotheca rogersii]|uniref:uncharacterized protein n=1 Tax=Durotheca rogersii TaxID=419775 RepID=UPI002221134E|nr:uncharacterized protein GGS23DRAFT_379405 [Durotheca rogersii]KAI5866289.1 hypothetical protein GGS23DRAFT_379405 [Durotheca rogersii]
MHFIHMYWATVASLASLSAGHVVLENPKPFRFVAYGPSNPISSTGSDFPCKIPSGGTLEPDGPPTVMAIGEEQVASFVGQAVHGGGSCQFALAGPIADEAWADYPLKNSEWKVIHSIEGGCPARNQKGNLEGPNQDKYSFTIPDAIAPGDYIFSWTWLARIGGQPEYYQNCAPITVTPAKAKRSRASDRRAAIAKRAELPELFMANMGDVSGGCTTGEALQQQVAIAFPDPGSSVERPEGSNLFKQACDGNPRAKKGLPQYPGDSDASASPVAAPTPTSSYDTSSVSTSTPAPLTSTASPTPPSTTSTQASSPSYDPTPSTGTCVEGHLTCLEDGTHFATCTGGQLTPPQPIAPGFKCRVGSGVGLDISPA